MALIECPDCGSKVSSEAAACPTCARPINAPKSKATTSQPVKKKGLSAGQIVLGLIVGLGTIGWLANHSTERSGPSGSGQTTQETQYSNPVGHAADLPVMELTPSELYKMYEANEVAADNQITGHMINITAPVKEIKKDFTDSAILVFDTGVYLSDVQAELQDNQKPTASRLRVGQPVTVQCAKARRIMNSPMLSSCVILD